LNEVSPGPEMAFRKYLEQGAFMIQRSRATGQHLFYPRVAFPGSGDEDLEWVPARGTGTVYAITVNRAREGSYNIAIVELDEGPRMMTHIAGVEATPIGVRVRARIAVQEGQPAVVFDVIGAVES
jgi:uncharacterized OB-fold protein